MGKLRAELVSVTFLLQACWQVPKWGHMTQDQIPNPISDPTSGQIASFDNHVASFQLDNSPVRGRAVHLGDALNEALGAGRYPVEVARMLGEAMMIAALVGRALKFKGRLVVQCYGTNEGAISLLAADCTTDGNIRGYARWDDEQLKSIRLDHKNHNKSLGAKTLLGGGTFAMTIDQGPDMDQYQGLSAIEGGSLAECAEHYFRQSEQIPSRVKLACGQVQLPGRAPSWRGGGIMIQRIAADENRGETGDDWETAKALFATLSDDELIDPDLTQEKLLYRLFHESGVRIVDQADIRAQCSCSEEKLYNTLKTFEVDALNDMAENGKITANCEFCATDYVFNLEQLMPR